MSETLETTPWYEEGGGWEQLLFLAEWMTGVATYSKQDIVSMFRAPWEYTNEYHMALECMTQYMTNFD